ncbi:MAG: extracellular solute-binding protein [Alphaproteobacteria bacterium]|nr:extracellular solute-binding protein [Alphaproteobacteria bacterium]
MLRRRTVLAAAPAAFAIGKAQAQEKRVVVYTAHISSIVDAMVPRFEKETGIKADVVKLASGDVIKRARAEAGAPRCDVIWSIGGDQLEENADLLQSYTPKEVDKLDASYMISKNYLPYTGVMYVLCVNKSMVKKADYPKTWADLADPKWKGKISSARADSSGSAFTQLTIVLAIFGDKGWDMYGKIFDNFVLSNSSGAVPRFVNDGEALIGVTLEDNALQYVQAGGNLDIVYPSDGTACPPDGIALVKGARNADHGKTFIDWCLAKPTQEFLVKEIGRRSVRTDVAASNAVPPFSSIKLVKLDSDQIAKDAKDLVAKWRTLAQARR